MNSGLPWIVLLAIGLPLAFAVLSFIVICREKRYVWHLEPMGGTSPQSTSLVAEDVNPYAATEIVEPQLEIMPVAIAHGRDLKRLGYTYVGPFRHAKGGIYQIRYDVMISPDRHVLAMIEAGKLMSLPVCNVSLISMAKREIDRETICLQTITNESCFEVDFARRNELMLLNHFAAGQAEPLHRQWLSMVEPIAFSDDPLNDLYQFRCDEQQSGIDNGMLRSIEEGITLPTAVGAVKALIDTYRFQIGRRLYPHQRRLQRKLKRKFD